jgi:hypothetical protein
METIFENREAYLQFRNEFRTWYNTEDNKKLMDAKDFALYAALRGRDWRKCFTANTDEKKIESIWRYLTKTKFQYLYKTPFGETITEEMIEKLRSNGFIEWGA